MADLATPSAQQQLLLRGGTVIDGSGAPPRRADVLIEGDTIADILPPGSEIAGAGVVELHGLALAPGFIDSHTHDDGYLLAHPDMVPKVSQGVTTVVTGNCGVSLAPVPPGSPLPQPLDLLGPPELFRYASFSSWMLSLIHI